MKAWKLAEKKVARLLDGQRRVRVSYDESIEDVIHPFYSIEVKYRKHFPTYWFNSDINRPIPKFILNGLRQAKSYDVLKLPILVIKARYQREEWVFAWLDDLPLSFFKYPHCIWADELVRMKLSDFARAESERRQIASGVSAAS